MAGFSSHGAGVDLLAPGYNILSAHLDGSLAVMSGTSQAAPFVAGAAVLALRAHPSWTPAQVRDFLVQATPDAITGLPSGTPNRLLYTGWSRDATAPAPGTGAPSAPNTPPAGGMPTQRPARAPGPRRRSPSPPPRGWLSYQWLRVDSSGRSSVISGATRAGCTLTRADLGKKVRVCISGTRPGYTTRVATSALSATIQR